MGISEISARSTVPIRASIEDFAWLTGTWRGICRGRTAEEIWSESNHNAMIAVFRTFQDDQLLFSAIYWLTQFEDRVELAIKCFSPDYVGWDERTDAGIFRLVHLDNQRALFYCDEVPEGHWIHCERIGDSLQGYFQMGVIPPLAEETFHLTRA